MGIVRAWDAVAPGEPMVLATREIDEGALAGDRALVEVAGCGVCHTDLGFLYEGVRTRHPFPLTLGHEIAGRVVAAGPDARHLVGHAVVVPAVVPCGQCDACLAGRGAICPAQVFPGNDDHGGFASHAVVPGRGLCVVDEARLHACGVKLSTLSVIADAVSTPYQALSNAELRAGDLAIFVGAGGVGGFGVQIAAARGAHVVAIDVDEKRLAQMSQHGAALTLLAGDPRELKKKIGAFAKERDIPTWRTFVFETSGSKAGQETAFALLGHGGFLSVVGYTPAKVELRLSNLMALDATAQGNWGCLPEHYPAIVELVLSGAVQVKPFVEHRPLSSINQTFADLHEHKVSRRVVLVPGS
jgi:6-hydroxycyclohex-1-ene-1-carbonyl-CoA dehydrogenase